VPFTAKLIVIAVSMSILINLVVDRGFVFALDPIKPRAENLNPLDGLKRMFSLRSLVELIKNLLKMVLLVAACAGTGVAAINAILRLPVCGSGCTAALFAGAIQPMLAAGAAVLLVGGLADLLVQRWLFLRQMKMSHSELKRERREQDGTPEIRNAQRRGRRELLQEGADLGPARATLFIEGEDVLVGLRYLRGETPVPRLVCKGRGNRARHLASLAPDVPRVRDDELAMDIDRRVEPGSFITEEFFNPVARALHLAAAQPK
jgi:type III secretion protein U